MIGDLVSLKRDWLWYFLGIILTPLLLARLGLTSTQTLAVGGFCVVLYGVILFWRYRLAFACFGVAFLLALGLLDVPHFIEFAGLDISKYLLIFLFTQVD